MPGYLTKVGSLTRDELYSKIEWANQHIKQLDAVIKAFKENEPYVIGHKSDPATGEYLVYPESAKPLPAPIPLMVGDIIHNLYSALDYLAWQLVLAAGNEPSNSTAFPIWKSPHPMQTKYLDTRVK